ncbi:hypothetical protein LOTGIDRAFT_163835 [Lottia gigantea]|uniref:Apple domain-containing protein n=1 Tax=Lottia gigantea TaxID=225164 RepID=V4A6I7_LOTGI|nr:hypothetical protein LOTGIDRAFT_163835 [Lottia gigantea]ESO90635.1 hypothetical protein LOTGIDRAFT_163835 [Lottia gigantea]
MLLIVVMFAVNSLVAFGGGNQCFQQDDLPNMFKNLEFIHPPFKSVTSLGPIDCARQCKLHTLCYFVNFNIETLNCSLISDTGDYRRLNPVSVMIYVKSWNENILRTCKNHQCPNNTVCKENNSGFDCQPIGCTGIPQVPNINVTSFTSKVLWDFNEVVEYACIRGRFAATNVTCTSNGFWSNVDCIQYTKCSNTRICSEMQSKDFWLYLSTFNSRRKVFCSFTGISNAAMYISLPEYNTASTPIYTRNGTSCELIEATDPSTFSMGYTDFKKIRNIISGKIKTTGRMYANSSFSLQDYGRAGDCYAGNDSDVCGVIGHFIIDLRGTGFKINSTAKWKTWGTDGVIQNITWSDDGRVIEGFCGGNCGGCEPDGELVLEADYTDQPANDSAELPICKFPLR